jgi:hypothetical protein
MMTEEEVMAQFTVICPSCSSELTLPPRKLLVRVDAGTARVGEILFTCLNCRQTASLTVDVGTVAALLAGGVTYLSLSMPTIDHPEARPDGPPLTHDDLLDLHAALADDSWLDRLPALES